MANNEYVNRVDFGDETLIDISDTTAEPEDVIEGQTFYAKSGAPATGTLGDATTTTHGLMSATDKVKLDEIDSKKAPIIIDSKSGNPIVINDGISEQKLYDMKVSFSPKQAGFGDPSPTNIRPITGWDEVVIKQESGNLLPYIDFVRENNGITYTYYSNGDLHVEGTSGSGGAFLNVPTDTYFTIEPGEYTLSGNFAGSKLNMYVVVSSTHGGDIKWNMNSSSTPSTRVIDFTDSSTRIQVSVNGNTTVNATIHPRVERGSSATPITSYPISWQSEAGTVYGGELDMLTGILTINMARADMGSATWTIGTNEDVHWFKSSRILTGAKALSSNSYMANIVSDRFKNIQAARIYSGEAEDNTIAQESVNLADSNLRVKATSYNDDTEAFKTAMNGVYVYYELATPLTYQLTPVQIVLLMGTNTIWTDTDNILIAYPIDTKKYIDTGARDVQINGISILDNGVVNIPIMTSSVNGVARVGNGLGMSSSGQLRINGAADSYLKAGTDLYNPVVSGRQHTSVFYGLAKLAGVDLANETVTVGQYPDSALSAIKAMFGITEIPAATSVDEGKVLRVVNGEWSAVSLPSVSEVSW